jgi:ABC-2 type transport system ATP-binding protein
VYRMTDAIATEDLGKTFPGHVEAVTGVNLSIRAGEIYGFLGPNGAGKTTTVAMLTTLLRPSRGAAYVEGLDVARHPEQVRRRIGLVFQRSTADEALTGRENLEIAAGLHGRSPKAARPRIRAVLERLDLGSVADRRVGQYSGGMRRRLEIAAGIIHDPEVLFLDEPTLGLDPQGRVAFWQYIRELRAQRGMTIFLTTHYLDEADQLADRVSIIDRGSILTTGTPAALKDALGGDAVIVRPAGAERDLAPLLSAIPGVRSVGPRDPQGTYRVSVPRAEAFVPLVVRACDSAGVEVAAIATSKPSLDQVFLRVTGRDIHSEAEPNGGALGRSPADGRPGGA